MPGTRKTLIKWLPLLLPWHADEDRPFLWAPEVGFQLPVFCSPAYTTETSASACMSERYVSLLCIVSGWPYHIWLASESSQLCLLNTSHPFTSLQSPSCIIACRSYAVVFGGFSLLTAALRTAAQVILLKTYESTLLLTVVQGLSKAHHAVFRTC